MAAVVPNVSRLAEKFEKNGKIDIPYGSPIQEILRAAERNDESLIVMGSQGRGFIGEVFLGSVSHQVVRGAAGAPFCSYQPCDRRTVSCPSTNTTVLCARSLSRYRCPSLNTARLPQPNVQYADRRKHVGSCRRRKFARRRKTLMFSGEAAALAGVVDESREHSASVFSIQNTYKDHRVSISGRVKQTLARELERRRARRRRSGSRVGGAANHGQRPRKPNSSAPQ